MVIIIRPKVGKDNENLRDFYSIDGNIKMVQSPWESVRVLKQLERELLYDIYPEELNFRSQ